MAELAFAPEGVFGRPQASANDGKSDSSAGISSQIPKCPECHSEKVWRDGHRTPMFGPEIQRWSCRVCGYKFSDPADVEWANKALQEAQKLESKTLKSSQDIVTSRQICVDNDKETKNLVAEQNLVVVPQKGELYLEKRQKLKGAIVEFMWYQQKNGASEDTYIPYSENLKFLVKNNADLFDPDCVKDVVSILEKTVARKYNLIKAYKAFMVYAGLKAQMPVYNYIRTLPFIPLESEIDQLIAGCSSFNTHMSVWLLLLKETGMRAGEAFRMLWGDIDEIAKTVSVRPEKGSNPRILKISEKLFFLLVSLKTCANPDPKARVFSCWKRKIYVGRSFRRMRKRIVKNTGNLRLLKIHFHTLRYKKGTDVYIQFKSLAVVMVVLGHKSWSSAQMYVDLVEVMAAGPEQWVSAVARTLEEALKLTDAGFQYDTDWAPGVKIYKKKA